MGCKKNISDFSAWCVPNVTCIKFGEQEEQSGSGKGEKELGNKTRNYSFYLNHRRWMSETQCYWACKQKNIVHTVFKFMDQFLLYFIIMRLHFRTENFGLVLG